MFVEGEDYGLLPRVGGFSGLGVKEEGKALWALVSLLILYAAQTASGQKSDKGCSQAGYLRTCEAILGLEASAVGLAEYI
jgi:hypothetical protein